MYTVREWLEEWLKTKECKAVKTYRHYKGVATKFQAFMDDCERGDVKINNVTRDDVVDFRQTYLDEGKTGRTANHRTETISTILKDAIKAQIISDNVAFGIEPVSEADSVTPIPLLEKDIKIILQKAPSRDWKGVCIIALHTGLRLHDITTLLWSQIDMEERTITVRPEKTNHKTAKKKKGKVLTIPMRKEVYDFLQDHPQPNDELAPVFSSLHEQTSGRLSQTFLRFMDKIGVKRSVKLKNKLGEEYQCRKTFHSFRHTFNSMLANSDVDQELRQKLTGHTSKETNDIYTHLDVETLRRAMDKLGSIKDVTTEQY